MRPAIARVALHLNDTNYYRSFDAILRIDFVAFCVVIVGKEGLGVMAAGLPVGTGNGRPTTAERSDGCGPEGATREIARGGSPAADPKVSARLPREIAHEVNNALAVIVGNLELIASDPRDPERTLRLVGRALEAVQRATQQTQRLRVAAMPFE